MGHPSTKPLVIIVGNTTFGIDPGTSDIILQLLRQDPRCGTGTLSNRSNIVIVPSKERLLLAREGPYTFRKQETTATSTSGGAASAGDGAAPPSPLDRLRGLLRQARVNVESEQAKKVLQRLVDTFPTRASLCDTCEYALDLYTRAKMMPGTTTLHELQNDRPDLVLDGILGSRDPGAGTLLQAFVGTKPMILKIPAHPEDADHEVKVWHMLEAQNEGLDNLAGPLESITLRETTKAVLMPRFACTTTQMIGNRVMLDTTVLKIAQHLLVAMGAMHKAGLAHCDIKPANTFVDEAGNIRLGDYGSTTTLGQPAASCTTIYVARELDTKPLIASANLDKSMLAHTVFELLQMSSGVNLSWAQLRDKAATIRNPELRDLLLGLAKL